ncbi:MAG: DUF5995 family protein [Bryobacteraceae bacterium]
MTSLAEATAYFEALQDRFTKVRDHRGVFVAAYVQITLGVGEKIRQGAFRDNVWVERYLVAFANLYRGALEAFEGGDLAHCPKAWQIAFNAAVKGETSVLQDLVLGMNAHINGDLPLALVAAGIGPDRALRKADHLAVNAILEAHTDQVQDSVAKLYAPVLAALDFAGGRTDELVAGFAIEKARESAWRKAVLFTDAPAAIAPLLRQALESETGFLAQAIRLPTVANPFLRAALRKIDEEKFWGVFLA